MLKGVIDELKCKDYKYALLFYDAETSKVKIVMEKKDEEHSIYILKRSSKYPRVIPVLRFFKEFNIKIPSDKYIRCHCRVDTDTVVFKIPDSLTGKG